MPDGTWNNGRLQRVIVPVGKFANGDERYRRANFDLLFKDFNGDGVEEVYILTPPADRQGNDSETIQSAEQIREEGNEYGFYMQESVILDPSAFPSGDAWPNLHQFDFV